MTDVFHQEANVPIEQAPLDVAPPAAVKSDWSATDPAATKRDLAGKERETRRSSIAAARAKVESGWKRPQHETKAERLARPDSDGRRQTGGLEERRSTLSSVQKAIRALEDVPSDKDFALSRKDRDAIRARHGDVGKFVQNAESWDKEFKKDPVATRERLLEIYTKVSPANFAEHQEVEKGHGVRGSIQQAQRDAADQRSLAAAEAKYGKNFPAILAQLQRFDADLIADPVGGSARLAANMGAPVTAAQEQQYTQKRAAEQHRAQDSANVSKALDMVVQHGVLPGFEDERVQHAIADVLESKSFQRTGNRLEDLKRAHAQVMQGRTAAKQDDRGSKSISGAPSTSSGNGRDQTGRNQTPVGSAVSRAFGKY